MINIVSPTPTPRVLSDEKLLELCSNYGKLALHYRRKFIGLLPEVNRRKLFQKKGFNSVFEFAFKLAGLSQEQVKRAISLDQKFSDKPILREVLVTGKVSVNKLARIASIATAENQEFLATQIELLPNRAIETFVKDIRHENDPDFVHVHKTHDPALAGECASTLDLSPEVIAKLFELQNKGLDINKLILEFLKEREEKIENKKAEISAQATAKKPSRHIPAKIKKIIHAEHGTKCAIANCQKSAQTIHHTARFALYQAHNSHYLAPLCHEHHLIAHTIDLNLHKVRSQSKI